MIVMTAMTPSVTHTSIATATPDFVVVDVETACSRVSSICQIGIVGFPDGIETFAYESLIDPRDHFSSFNTRIHGITATMSSASQISAA